MNLCSGVSSVCAGWKCVGVYVGLPSANSFAPVPPVTAGGDCGDGGDVLFALLSAGFKFLSLLFSHTMRMMMRTIVTTSSTATTPATIPADDPLVVLPVVLPDPDDPLVVGEVVLPPDLLSVVHFTSA